jgi:hypothetical protein
MKFTSLVVLEMMAKTITIKIRKNQGQTLRMVLNLSARVFLEAGGIDCSSVVIWFSRLSENNYQK